MNETSVYHEIIIPSDASLLLDGVDLNTGDFVGVFFINNEGVLSCGGYTIWAVKLMDLMKENNFYFYFSLWK